MDNKVIVTNRSALTSKYGKAGLTKINKALTLLKSADKKRGIQSRVIFLDDKASMKKWGATAIVDNTSPRQYKQAIDSIFKKLQPEYLMILGAPDVVPHQDLYNLAYVPGSDDDRFAWSDLPYACSATYSRDPARFIGPTRVVGRLPDVVGATEPDYLISLLQIAANYQSRSLDDYEAYFSLSTVSWKKSTQLSLNTIFGNHKRLRLSPTLGPKHPAGLLASRMHFINCHGGQASPEFQGQKYKSYPIALTSQSIEEKIKEGAVAAVECCYGAELYDALTLGIDLPICQHYLLQGAYGYLGSTTIAYGPADYNALADVICQQFLLNIYAGASLGRAALMARQQFVADTGQMDPFDLKTLSQFYLLGDPSIHPVAHAESVVTKDKAIKKDIDRFARAERRAKLQAVGNFLEKTKPTASKLATTKVKGATKQSLQQLAKESGMGKAQTFISFNVKVPAAATTMQKSRASGVPTQYHIALDCPEGVHDHRTHNCIALVAKELQGKIVGYRVYHQR